MINRRKNHHRDQQRPPPPIPIILSSDDEDIFNKKLKDLFIAFFVKWQQQPDSPTAIMDVSLESKQMKLEQPAVASIVPYPSTYDIICLYMLEGKLKSRAI
jgi:hypothetical protein